MAKKDWKPIEQYFDLDGISNRVRNREEFDRFVRSFGWTEYMFHPVVMDFEKLLAGRRDYNKIDPMATGFARVADDSFEKLGGHGRAFRNQDAVMLASTLRTVDSVSLDAWCRNHNAVYVICGKQRAFHNNGVDTLVLFMNRVTAARYASVLDVYQENCQKEEE